MASSLHQLTRPYRRTLFLLLALLLGLSSSLSISHIHDLDDASGFVQIEQLDNCAFCHAGAAAAVDSDIPFGGAALADPAPAALHNRVTGLVYTFYPESRAPPHSS